jgi:tetratricopeptide (TPR) repeat protein
MLAETQDRHTIFTRAIECASAEERDAYLAQACGNDPVLRRQVEELVAAHLRTESREKPAHPAANGTSHAGRDHQRAGANHAETHTASPHATPQPEKPMRKLPRGLVITGALLLVSTAVASICVAVWAWRAEEQARVAAEQAVDESNRARKDAEEAERQRDQARAAWQTIAKARDQALAEEAATRNSEQGTKAVLAFVQNKLLASGRPTGWTGGQGKDVTLRKAVEAAESKILEAFAGQPLAEASLREIFGSTYLDLGEAALAVPHYERALALREALLGPDHADTSDYRNKLAVAYRLANRHDDASRLFDHPLNSASHASALAIRGSKLLSQKKPDEAEKLLRECLSIRQKIQPDDWTTFEAKAMLGEALQDQKKYADAEPELLSGYEGLKRHEAKIPPQDKARLTQTLERLVLLYESWGKNDRAAKWRKELEMREATKKFG